MHAITVEKILSSSPLRIQEIIRHVVLHNYQLHTHSLGLSLLCLEFSALQDLSEDQTTCLVLGAYLHEVGLIINKKCSNYPLIGAMLVKMRCPEIDDRVASIIMNHKNYLEEADPLSWTVGALDAAIHSNNFSYNNFDLKTFISDKIGKMLPITLNQATEIIDF